MLTATQQRICELMGTDPHQFIAMNSENSASYTEQKTQEELEHQARIREAEQAVMKLMNISPAELSFLQEQQDACKLTLEETEVCQKMGILPVDYLVEKMKAAGIYKSPHGNMTIK